MRWSELHAVEFHLVQALLHDLKAEAWALLRDVPHCRAEARDHRADARRAFAPSMRQKIDIPDLYRDALHRLPNAMDGQAPMALPTKSPLTLEQLLPRRRKIGDVPGRLRKMSSRTAF